MMTVRVMTFPATPMTSKTDITTETTIFPVVVAGIGHPENMTTVISMGHDQCMSMVYASLFAKI